MEKEQQIKQTDLTQKEAKFIQFLKDEEYKNIEIDRKNKRIIAEADNVINVSSKTIKTFGYECNIFIHTKNVYFREIKD